MIRGPVTGLPDHDELSGLLPWYVNGTLGEPERQHIEAHLAACAVCRDEVQRERLVYQRLSAKQAVEYLPGPSLQRLQARLDGMKQSAPPAHESGLDGKTLRQSRRAAWRMAAAAAVVAVVVGVVAVNGWMPARPPAPEASYHTVTTPVSRPAEEVIRAVFSPSITLVELQAILDESQLRIISGPTEAGVYSLAATSSRPVVSSLAILRQHSGVRFAESTLPLPKAGPLK